MTHPSDVSSRPLIIGGMHRSGTSLTASLFAAAGLDLGPALLQANDSNPEGHFEDLAFFDFHRRALLAQGLCGEGYTATGGAVVPAGLEQDARDLLAARVRPGVAWGWKEPRTALFLDFWQERLPDARHLFVFRRPWEVADSLFRRGDETFALNPMFALEVWTHYNRLIIDFVRRHPEHCLVFEIARVIADPDRVIAAVRSRFDMPLGNPTQRYRPELFTVDRGSTHAAIVRTAAPEAWQTYRELRDLAVDDVADDARPRRETSPGECAVLEWARASRAEVGVRQAATREARLQGEFDARLRAEHDARLRAEHEARLQAEHAARLRAEHEARLWAEQETRLWTEFQAQLRAEHDARRRPASVLARALRRATGKVPGWIRTASKRLLARPQAEPPAPAIVPFERPEGAATGNRVA